MTICVCIRQIPHRLYQEGYRAHRGGTFANILVHRILSQPAYKGLHPLGIKMPVLIDEVTWNKAEKKRVSARHVRREIKGWLLQGLYSCGYCGRLLSCSQKKGKRFRYYVCRGKYAMYHADGSAPCLLSNWKADDLEVLVWQKGQEAINQPEVMREFISKSLANLEEKKNQTGDEVPEIEKQLGGIKTKLERLTLTFADGAIDETLYRVNLEKLKKQQLELTRRQQAIDPSTLMEILETQERIKAIKEILDHGSLRLNALGFFGLIGDKYIPVGFNPWRETDGKLEVGQLTNMSDVKIPGTDIMFKSMAPQGIIESTPAERTELLKKDWRGILRFSDIHVKVFNDRIEIHGLIPPQVIAIPEKKQPECALISCSGRRRGKGVPKKGLSE